jgi:hypothetical protein
MTPFVRNLGIVAIVAILIVVLNEETALNTASILLRFAFIVVIGVVAYFFWRDFGRREISMWPERAAWTLYAAVGLFVVDLGWYMLASLSGRDALVFFVVAAICVYVAVRTWRAQRSAL